jgi:hypothetical protein
MTIKDGGKAESYINSRGVENEKDVLGFGVSGGAVLYTFKAPD